MARSHDEFSVAIRINNFEMIYCVRHMDLDVVHNFTNFWPNLLRAKCWSGQLCEIAGETSGIYAIHIHVYESIDSRLVSAEWIDELKYTQLTHAKKIAQSKSVRVFVDHIVFCTARQFFSSVRYAIPVGVCVSVQWMKRKSNMCTFTWRTVRVRHLSEFTAISSFQTSHRHLKLCITISGGVKMSISIF